MGHRTFARRAFALALFAFVSLFANAAAAQEWAPTRPMRLIVPFPPGGTADLLGRIARAASLRRARPAGGDREPRRRRHADRDRDADPLRAGRIHHRPDRKPARLERDAREESLVQSHHRHPADDAGRAHQPAARGEPGRESEHRAGARSAREGGARHDPVRLVGHRHGQPDRGRNTEAQDAGRSRPRPLPRRRAGHERCRRRTDRDDVQRIRLDTAAGAGGEIPRARDHRREALADPARRSDDGGGGRARSRNLRVVRARRPRRHAAGGDQAHSRRDDPLPATARTSRPASSIRASR